MVARKPARWSGSDDALRAVQVAFDVELAVMDAIRAAAFHNNLSTSDQIRQVLELSVSTRPKRPRLTVSLTAHDYALLAQRYGLDEEDRLAIKEKVTQDLIRFASPTKRR
jgi:TolB-like protein